MRYDMKADGGEYMIYLYFKHHDGRNIVLSAKTENQNIEYTKALLSKRKVEEYDQHLNTEPTTSETPEV
jgi:hypothetical protein